MSECVSSVKKKFKKNILKLYKEYFKCYIKMYLENNPAILAKCGWIPLEIGSGKAFLSVNYHNGMHPDIVNDLFNGGFKNTFFQRSLLESNPDGSLFDVQEMRVNFEKLQNDFNTICKKNDYLKALFSLILNDFCLLAVFAYSIHGIFWDYLKNYQISGWETEEIFNRNSAFFSMCIYGKSAATSKTIANLLANFFVISENKWDIIDPKYHVSFSSSFQEKIEKLSQYKSVPIIVTLRNNHFTEKSRYIKTLYQKKVDSLIHCYPIYISDTPVLTDKMVNYCSDSAVEKLKRINCEDLNEIHSQFCVLVYHFICYLTKISNQHVFPDREDETYFSLSIYELPQKLDLTKEWIDTHIPNFLLYRTMDSFCRYLESTPLCTYADQLREFSEICFLKNKKLNFPTNKSGVNA